MSAVNEDNPAELFASVSILSLVYGMVRGPRWYVLLPMVLFAGLAVATKPTTYYLIPVLALLLLIYGWRKTSGAWRLLVLPVLLALLFGLRLMSSRFESIMQVMFSYLSGPKSDRFLSALVTAPSQASLADIVSSFWADMGWRSLQMEEAWGWALLLPTVGASVGLVKLTWCCVRPGAPKDQRAILCRVAWVFVLCLACDVAFMAGGAATGNYGFVSRYLMGATLPIMALLVIGWRELIPTGWRREGFAALTSFFFLFDALALGGYALPFFYRLWR